MFWAVRILDIIVIMLLIRKCFLVFIIGNLYWKSKEIWEDHGIVR